MEAEVQAPSGAEAEAADIPLLSAVAPPVQVPARPQ
jgi:hypothetical protein